MIARDPRLDVWPKASVVGVLGGSFDPAHRGHLSLTRAAAIRFGLGEVWWLVTPGNPLKSEGPAPLARRMARARRVAREDGRIRVTDLEARLGTRHTADTLAALTTRWPRTRFVWLMGADNLATVHHWRDWQSIFALVPVGVLARPGHRQAALRSVAARRFAAARLPAARSRLLAKSSPPAWCFLNMPMLDVSSTAIRARGDWKAATSAPSEAE